MAPTRKDKLAALCSAAIGVIYAAGYFVTEPSHAEAITNQQSLMASANPDAKAPQQGQFNAQKPPRDGGRGHGHRDDGQSPWGDPSNGQGMGQGNGASAGQGSGQGTVANSGQSAGSSTTANGSYKDGTFTGSGSNRIGTVEVAVTIKSGKITAVEITNCDTHYSQSRIDNLPQQALQRQSNQVDNVSGATRSTEDFREAVRQALAQAQA